MNKVVKIILGGFIMTNPFKPTHDLYIIPMNVLETELKKWLINVKKLNLPFEFDCESSESSFGHMGDLYFIIKEEELSEEDKKAIEDVYEEDLDDLQLDVILKEFFEADGLSYDVEPFDEDVYIMIPK